MNSETTEAAGKASLDPLVVPDEIRNAFIRQYESDGKHKWGRARDKEHCIERFAFFLCGAVTAAEFEHRHNEQVRRDSAAPGGTP